MSLLQTAKRIAGSLAGRWAQPSQEETLRREWAGQTSTEAEALAARMGKPAGPAEVQQRMGRNSRGLMQKLGLALPQTARAGMQLAEIDRSCKACGDWRECTEWLDSGTDPEAYRKFCPNAARLDEIARD